MQAPKGEQVAAGSDAATGGVASVNADRSVGSGGAVGPDGQLAAQRVIYFDFDSSDIRGEFVDVIATHGALPRRQRRGARAP